jgi:AcrR family transcriptional regulator
VTVGEIQRLAGVSRTTFYALFAGREDCAGAAIDGGVSLAVARVAAVDDPEAGWVDRVRAGLGALLALTEDEPELARLCLGRALVGARSPALAGALEQLSKVLDEGHRGRGSGERVSPLAAEFVLGGALNLLHARLVAGEARSLGELSSPLMYMVVLPYLGQGAARRELSRREAERIPGRVHAERRPLVPSEFGIRMTYRTMRVLVVIGERPGLSNLEVAERAGVLDQGQISKLLARLGRLGLVENTGEGAPRGAANAWRLTREGMDLKRAVTRVSRRGSP